MNKEELGLVKAEALFKETFRELPERRIVSYGRLEILGNHTDHQLGKCLVAGCTLGIRSAVKAHNEMVSVISEGYPKFSFPLDDLDMKEEEKGTSIGLTRGVIKALKEKGYQVGGFLLACNSDIFPGAGVSSSAAYELLIAETVNALYNEGKIPLIEKAKAGQYAENAYFGKASGLLDQTGSSFGGIAYLDFADKSNVVVKPIRWPFEKLRIVLVNPGASHAGLSDLYSQMPLDMKSVAQEHFGKEVLSLVPEEDYLAIAFKESFSNERARLRALHFYEEQSRVERCRKAIEEGNLLAFLECERATQFSQTYLLQNVMVPGQYEGSPLQAVHIAKRYLVNGASRVMGGGLVGSTINFVPEEELDSFLEGMKRHYKAENIEVVGIPPVGAHEVK